MSPLVKKEIRVLLPSFSLGLLLAFSVWLIPAGPATGFRPALMALPYLCCPAMLVMMILDSFGHELSAGTFSLLLSQPVPRTRIWWTKTLLLAVAALLIWLVWCVCYFLHNPDHVKPVELRQILAGFGLFVLAGYSGGLWTTLLFRQVAAAFWFTILIPATLIVILGNLLENYSANVQFNVPVGVFTIYGIAGFLLARRLFMRAQDVAWTGGTVSLPAWSWYGTRSESETTTRRCRPFAALLGKEWQLHQISLLCAAGLLALHLIIVALRKFDGGFTKHPLSSVVSDFYWLLWLVLPVIIGSTAVAEERKLGVMEGQFCLPVSRRAQFIIKFILTLVVGTLLGGLMPLLVEDFSHVIGAPGSAMIKDFFRDSGPYPYQLYLAVLVGAFGLSLAAFFASTLARNFLQALSTAILIVLGCVLFTSFIAFILRERITFFGITPWHSILPFLIAILIIPAALLWLAWLNFSHFHESWRLWRRNLLGLTGAVVFVLVSSTAIYNCVWEIFEPAEPPHSPAKFSSLAPPKLQSDFNVNLLVRLPDGRVWFDSLHYSIFENQYSRWNEMWWMLAGPSLKSAGPRQFIAGSNWVSVTAARVDRFIGNMPIGGYLDTVGVKDDGTLWISAESKPEIWTGAKMIRFGDENNWQQITRSRDSFVLLKNNGTLWRWGTSYSDWDLWHTNWPTVRTFKPRQIGTNADWNEIIRNVWWIGCARKADGSVWTIDENYKTGQDELRPATHLDQVVSQTLSLSGQNSDAYIGKDGTLRAHIPDWENGAETSPGFQQIGKETNWVSVAISRRWMVALKSDGSLWKWDIVMEWDSTGEHSRPKRIRIPPTRLGNHNDWVAIGKTWGGVVSLAADGSLWLWPGTDYNEMALLKAPKQPQFLSNVFGKAD